MLLSSQPPPSSHRVIDIQMESRSYSYMEILVLIVRYCVLSPNRLPSVMYFAFAKNTKESAAHGSQTNVLVIVVKNWV